MKISKFNPSSLRNGAFTAVVIALLLFYNIGTSNAIHALKGSRVLKSKPTSSSLLKDGLPNSSNNRRSLNGNRSRHLQKDEEKLPPGLPQKRTCELKSKGDNEVEFECKADSNDGNLKIKDKIKFKVLSSSEGATIQVEYANKIETTTSRRRRVQTNEDGVSKTSNTPMKNDDTMEDGSDVSPPQDSKSDASTSDNNASTSGGEPNDGKVVEPKPQDNELANGTESDPSKGEGGDPSKGEGGDPSKGGDTNATAEGDSPKGQVDPKPQGNDNSKNMTETKTNYEITYSSIIEYTKGENGTSAGDEYDFENDEIVQTIPLTEWSAMSDITDHNDGVTSTFSVETVDKLVQLNFTVVREPVKDTVSMSDSTTTNNNTQKAVSSASMKSVTASNKMKIDFTLYNFPWIREDSFVALLSTVQSERKVNVDHGGDTENVVGTLSASPGKKMTEKAQKVDISFDDAIDATGGFVTIGEYSWESTAVATKRKRKVQVSSTPTAAPKIQKPTTSNVVLQEASLEETKTNVQTTGQEEEEEEEESSIQVVATALKVVDETDSSSSSSSSSMGPSPDKKDKKQTIAYSFLGAGAQSASKIYWDPEAGIAYNEQQQSSSTSTSSSSSAASYSLFGNNSSDFLYRITFTVVIGLFATYFSWIG